jgi:very-short-patch-repair endonuclease
MMICKECNREFETLESLSKHRALKHKIPSVQTYIDYKLDGIKPICKCGCGELVKFLGIHVGFREYAWGHASRVNNNWGHNPEALKKSHETQKQMHSTGKLQIWNKGLTMDDERVKDNIEKVMSNPERGDNISKALTGIPKSNEHKFKMKERSIKRWQNQDERNKQSQRRVDWMANNDFTVKSKTETTFNDFLLNLGLKENIDYKRQHYVREIKAFYDFFIYKSFTYIEVDGDFWHCNPNSRFSIAVYESQKKNLLKDQEKNSWCINNDIKLLRFWESDINNKPEEVITRLKQEIGGLMVP